MVHHGIEEPGPEDKPSGPPDEGVGGVEHLSDEDDEVQADQRVDYVATQRPDAERPSITGE